MDTACVVTPALEMCKSDTYILRCAVSWRHNRSAQDHHNRDGHQVRHPV
jgi:hypothetical protein